MAWDSYVNQGVLIVIPFAYTYDQHGRDLKAFLDGLGLKQVVLVGWSFGVLNNKVSGWFYSDRAIFGDRDRVAGFHTVQKLVMIELFLINVLVLKSSRASTILPTNPQRQVWVLRSCCCQKFFTDH